MARLIYSALASLDGYVADRDGVFDWAAPDEEVHAAVNDLLRPVGTQLYGRRTYDVLAAWETIDAGPDQAAAIRDFAQLWRSADKVVYSRTLDEVSTARTRLERDLDTDAVLGLKASATDDLSIGGPELAGQAIRAGLVDEVHLFLSPVLVGGGTRALPDDVHVELELVRERRFGSGVIHLGYRVR